MSSPAFLEPLEKIWNSHCPLATSALIPSRLIPASRVMIDVFLDDGTSDIADIFVAYCGVVGALGGWISVFGESQRAAVFVEEVLLFETDPKVGHLIARCAEIRWVGLAVGEHDFAEDQKSVGAGAIWIESYWLEQAIGASALGLLSRASIEPPHGEIGDARGSLVDYLGLAAHVGLG